MTTLRHTLRKALVVPAVSGLAVAGVFLTPQATAAVSERVRLVSAEATLEVAEAQSLRVQRRPALRPIREAVTRPEIAPVTAVLPVAGYQLTGRFGNAGAMWSSSHTGLDFAAPLGTPVRAVVGGRVVAAEYAGAYGMRVTVIDDKGRSWWYCHLSAFGVSVGQVLAPGDHVGALGSTGNSTGPHLHLEIRDNDVPIDPESLLPELGVQP
ncbi:M23 family metallopeptidase [Nocardioides sp. GY 10113]|uniref:M23 family metallopeptidase n=1 Tax=Nocardioides sp. GY 10113 TaxID=2569761 RepID=UPI001458DC44|nr:M23 family metallopeptidase [Nocardioides sp. GY 10113]